MNKISVIVPNHLNKNLDKLVDEIIKFKPLEIIIINNKSEADNSKNTNDTVKYYNITEKKNASTNRNYGALKAQGDFFSK